MKNSTQPMFKKPGHIICDIEGTTTSISFVHEVLFPYSKDRLPRFIEAKEISTDVKILLDSIKSEFSLQSTKECVDKLLYWINKDIKQPQLKALQGLIWEEGYKAAAYHGHVYPDAVQALKEWKAMNIELGIYSSGSVHAQKLLFGHTEFGDLNSLFSFNFDTKIGHKRDPQSYENILHELKISNPKNALFLSDIEEELNAASVAGLQTVQILRPGSNASSLHPTSETLNLQFLLEDQ